ncbi:hypothetical protein [Pseudooceanicola sp.]|uniref:hypothetical protein n=1 Tax=Pseudooceanicola sp. TaxID=1914328 RepID=UPI0035C6A401
MPDAPQPDRPDWRDRLRRAAHWIETRLPPVVRSLVGVLLIIGGLFGFLPILGFWMIPLGIACIAVDLRAAWRWLRPR